MKQKGQAETRRAKSFVLFAPFCLFENVYGSGQLSEKLS
jgi:hypothetical protein